MEHQVSGCKDCPLNSNDKEFGDACRHPLVREENGNDKSLPEDANNHYETITPDWCPLSKEPITIIKK